MDNIGEILKLSSAEKILLVEKLWDSLPNLDIEITDAKRAEVRKRIARHQAGKTVFFYMGSSQE